MIVHFPQGNLISSVALILCSKFELAQYPNNDQIILIFLNFML